jgi:hypothetical protein
MLASNLTIADSAAANKSFVAIASTDGSSVRLDNSSTAQLPRKMRISHGVASYKIGAERFTLDRRLVSFSVAKADTAGLVHTGSINVTIQVPRISQFAESDLKHLWYFEKNFFTDANLTSILLGEA